MHRSLRVPSLVNLQDTCLNHFLEGARGGSLSLGLFVKIAKGSKQLITT